MKMPSGPVAQKIGFALCRVIVPIWVLSGALMKLFTGSPKLLPENLWRGALELGLHDLHWLLAVLIALEFFAVAVMFVLPRFARFMAIWMLAIFVLVLIAEIAAGHTACGCLGSFSPPPWLMLCIDGALLAGVLLFAPSRAEGRRLPAGRLALTALLTVAGLAGTLALVRPWVDTAGPGSAGAGLAAGAAAPPESGPAGSPPAPATATSAPASSSPLPAAGAAAKLPRTWAVRNPASWLGRRFRELPLAGFVKDWPAELEVGPRYVIFYRRSCDHCQAYLETHFPGPPPVPTTLVAIPEDDRGFREEQWLDMAYCSDCVEHLALPEGVDWLIVPPLVIALAEGEVVCVKEGDEAAAPECLSFGS